MRAGCVGISCSGIFGRRVALYAEKIGHHPDWTNSYKRVHVELFTYDVGGLSELDFLLAHEMNLSLQ